MNRPLARPGAGGAGTQTLRPGQGTRPGADGGGIQRPTRPGEDGGGIRPDRPLRPDDDGNRLPDGRPDRRPNRPGEGGAGERWTRDDWRDWAHEHRPDRIPDRDRWRDWREDHRDEIRDQWRDRWQDHDDWFDDDWRDRHDIDINYFDDDFNYWAWAAWPAMMGWIDYGWSEPAYYNYGENVYYTDDSVYYGDQPVATAAEYAQQAETIATNVPEQMPAAEDWMPLGVFAVTTDGQPTGAEPTMYLQLAVSKQGVISGTFQNTATDAVQEVEGMVDKQTQRAAWTAKGKTRPLMETGIVNLTQDTTPALVHFADGTTQQWLLVRMEEPPETASSTEANNVR